MPHEVIMPALGMAQETGRIIAWLKQPGEAVAEGDPLFEVETDKAAMEVEAQADGFLGQVSASAGEDVPVGRVVAIIADSAEEAAAAGTGTAAAAAADDSPQQGGSGDDDALPDGAQVIMPALGMAQDSGLIVSWAKQPGDPVSADDVLLEVETDKSVMEVTAGHDGFIAAILADAGQAVPVGSVIAVISQTEPAAPVRRSLSAGPTDTDTSPAASPEPAPAARSPKAQAVAASQAGGRILASPKARRIAAEEGLDLALLAAHGVPQPFHVADLETLRGLGAAPEARTDRDASRQLLHVHARVSSEGCDSLIGWLEADGGTAIAPRLVWLRFAAAALRKAIEAECEAAGEAVTVELRKRQDAVGRYADPDRARLSQPLANAGDSMPPALVLRDFTGSRVVSASGRADAAPVLTIGREKGDYVISLDFHDGQMSESQAFALVDDFADRLADPLRHLL